MSTRVEKSVMVNVPVSRAYNQWTQFEEFPRFMGGVQSVTQLGDDRLQWVAEIGGVRRQWEARILEQVPDQKVAWAATEGATNAGSVMFEDLGGDQTSVTLVLEYEPEGLVEKVGDKLNLVENQAENDLERFKDFIESEGYASGAWRGSVEPAGSVGTPGVEDAAASRGDSGKAGVSGKVAAAGVAAAAAAAAAVVGARSGSSTSSEADEGSAASGAPVESTPVTAPVGDGRGGAGDTGGTDRGASGGEGDDIHLLTDEEIEAGASDVPLQASEQGEAERDLGSNR
jgi:carbon monoxide dehydrogenase subunit G